MTDEQKEARKRSAAHGPIKWIKDNCLRTADGGEDYVFISYKSDDYERALDDVLYRTCQKYGLRVYFDVAFDDGSDSWIKQFYKNMCSPHCKAMIAFISNKYYSSYATLMEMMARKTVKAGGNYCFDKLFFIPINLEPIMDEKTNGANTGLGTARFSDGRINHQASVELAQFNLIFKQLAKKDEDLYDYYDRFDDSDLYREATPDLPEEGEPYLLVTQCRVLMSMVRPKSNENDGTNKAFEDAIHDKLVTAKLESVFIPNWKAIPPDPVEPSGPVETPELPKPVEPTKPLEAVETEAISLPAFLKKYNTKTFLKETYQKCRLVGRGECAKYNTEFFDSTAPLTWSFIRKVLEERGQDYISLVVEKNTGKKNPPFITAEAHQVKIEQRAPVKYRRIDVPGLENWSMCTNFGQYSWISDVLCRRILDLNLSLEDFFLEYVPSREAENSGDTGNGEPLPSTELNNSTEVTAPISGPVGLDGKTQKQKKSAIEKDGYSFTLRGESYLGLKLKNMILTVFKTTLDCHPDKLDLLLESLPCLSEKIKISPDAHPTTFHAGDTIEINGRSISIGTSMNQSQALKYIKKLMQLCGEPKENLVIDGYDYYGEG